MPPPYCPVCGIHMRRKLRLCNDCLRKYKLAPIECICKDFYGPPACKFTGPPVDKYATDDLDPKDFDHDCDCDRNPNDCRALLRHECVCDTWNSLCQASPDHICICPGMSSVSICRAKYHSCLCEISYTLCKGSPTLHKCICHDKTKIASTCLSEKHWIYS